MASEELLGPLPAGRHGFSREQVAHNQRERLLAGFATAVAEHGYNAVTIAHVTKAAAVSRRVFYENFEGKEECFLATFDAVTGHVGELIGAAVESAPDWPQQAIAAAREVLAFLAAEPDLARLVLVESQSAGPTVAARFHAAVRQLWRRSSAAAASARPTASCRRTRRTRSSAPSSPSPAARRQPAKPTGSASCCPTSPSSSSRLISGPTRPPASLSSRPDPSRSVALRYRPVRAREPI